MKTLISGSFGKVLPQANVINLLFAGLLLAALTIPAQARANEEVYQRLLPATVWVRVPGVSSGSGVLVDQQRRWVVTNYHVVEDNTQVRVYFPVYNNGELVMERKFYTDNETVVGVAGKVIARATDKDLAIIELDRLPQKARAIPLATTSPRPAQALHVVANQGGTDALWTYTSGKVRSVIKQSFPLRIPGSKRTIQIDARIVVTDLATNPGDSGGPVVNDKAELVALVSSGRNDKRLVSECIDITEIRALLVQTAQGGTQVVQGPRFDGISGIGGIGGNQQPQPVDANPQPPAQNFSLVGSWQGKLQLPTGVTATFDITMDNASRFTFDVSRSDGARFSKQGTYQMNGNQLVMTADGKLLVSGQVIFTNGDSFTLVDSQNRTVFTRTNGAVNPQPPVNANPQPPVNANPQPPVNANPQPAQNFSIEGVWSAKMTVKGGVEVELGLALMNNGSFGFAANRADGQQFRKAGTWQMQGNRLILTSEGQTFISGTVTPNGATSFTLDDGQDRIVFTKVNVQQPANPVGANPAPAPQQLDLTGTTWSGTENLQGFGNLTFQFQAGGQAVMTDAAGNSQGTWSLQGNQVTLTFANGRVVYRGVINGQTMSGNATGGGGNWTFTLQRS